MHDVYSSFLAPLLPLLVEKFGITLSVAGMLDVIRNLPSLVNPFFGLMADRISVKYFVIVSPAITAITMSLLGIAPGYGVAAIMIFVMGISATLFHVPSPVLIKGLSGQKTGRGMSFYMLGGELSRTVGPLVITGAITLWGLEGTWRLIPFGLAASCMLFFILRDYRRPAAKRPVRRVNDRIEHEGASFKELLPYFGSIGGYTVFMMAMKVSVTLYLPAYLVEHGKTLMSASILLSLLQLAGAAGTLFAGTISDIIGRKSTLYISGLVCPGLLWLFLVSGDSFTPWLLGLLGFFLFASGPVLLALVQDADPASPAFANGTYMTINFVIRSIIVVSVGLLIQRIGFDLTYTVTAFLAIGVLPFIFLIPDEKNRRRESTG